MLKILPDHIMNHHMVAAAEGGCHHVVRGGRRPPIIMWSGSIFSICPLLVFGTFGPFLVFFSICLRLHFQLSPPIVFRGKSRPTTYCVFSFPVYKEICKHLENLKEI
mgnify:CR=1 FL=1